MRKRNIVPVTFAVSALAMAMVVASGAGTAWAYFTSNTDATGGYALSLADEVTTVDEEFSFDDWTKRVVITNAGESGRPVYVRARAYSGSQYTLSCEDSTNWIQQADEYWYYGDILEAGESTEHALLVKITGVPEEVKDAGAFNVVVIYETTPVQYDAQGEAYADWNLKQEDVGKASLGTGDIKSSGTEGSEGTGGGGNS